MSTTLIWSWTMGFFVVTVTLPLWLSTCTTALEEQVHYGVPLPQLNETSSRKSSEFNVDKSPEESKGTSYPFNEEQGDTTLGEMLPSPVPLMPDEECHPVYSFDVIGPYRQDQAKNKTKERIYYYRETDENEDDNTILAKDEFGLICFTRMINCTVPPTALSVTSRKIPNCIHFAKEFCTRDYRQMKWKGSVCRPIVVHQQDFQCSLRVLGEGGGIDFSGMSLGRNNITGERDRMLNCKNGETLCLSLKPPFHHRYGNNDRNPLTQTLCLCPLGYTGSDCGRMDVDLFHLDLLHTVDLRNILLKYQQKDRYFIGVTLLFILLILFSSVLLVSAGCSYLFRRLPEVIPHKKNVNLVGTGQLPTIHGESRERGDADYYGTSGVGLGMSRPCSVRRSTPSGTTVSRSSQISLWRNCFDSIKWPWNQVDVENEDEGGDSDLELRFHRRRMRLESCRHGQGSTQRGRGRAIGQVQLTV